MRIYTKLRIDLDTMEVLEEESFEYAGPIALCGGSNGETSTTVVDYLYNARMADLSEEQQGWAGEMLNQYKYGESYNPNEEIYVDANGNVVDKVDAFNQVRTPGMTPKEVARKYGTKDNNGKWRVNKEDLIDENSIKDGFRAVNAGEFHGYDESKVSEMDFKDQTLQYDSEQLALRDEMGLDQTLRETEESAALFAQHGIADQTKQIDERAPVISEYYKEALQGDDVGAAMDTAQADAAIGLQGAQGALSRNLSRSGVSAGSNLGINAAKDLASDYSKNAAFARTQARQDTQDSNFSKLESASERGIV